MSFPRAVLSALTVAALSIVTAADCGVDHLITAADTYMAAQSSAKLDDLQKLLTTGNFTYRQNNKSGDLKTGLLSKVLKLDHNRTTVDTTACASYTELVSVGGPYVIGTQIRHTADASEVVMIDTIVATTGDWAFGAAQTLSHFSAEDWGTLEASERSSRDTLQAAADAYLDMWSNGTAINAVPWGTPCARTEGSAYVTPSCKSGAPSGGGGARNSDRRYVIDETVGSCNVLCAFGGQMPDSHEFRLISGKLRLVHTITV